MNYEIPTDHVQHYMILFNRLERERGWFESRQYLRYAALPAVNIPLAPEDAATAIRSCARVLKSCAGWFDQLRGEIRYVIAATIVLGGDDPEAFYSEYTRVRKLFRSAGVRRDATYELLAVVVLRMGIQRKPIDDALVQRMQAVFKEMQRYEWWLTDAGDLPACAMLALRGEPVGLIMQEVDQILGGLQAEGFSKGNELQAAAHLLFLSDDRAELAVQRAGILKRAFKSKRQSIRRSDYDEIALLAFLLIDPEQLVERVLACRDKLRAVRPRPDKRLAFNIAANLAFLDLVRQDSELLRISEIKLIADIQALVAAQRAAAAAAAAG